ncbi:hypothetical protein [Rubellimicrobium roseum]|uniref:Uncharacterized protein n=1 Tax=Rubellimicrobium roseum TaxID=687525 RepID=A0A5C4N5Y7_9RHOB|nr:hypothetical protein [Rubellimicrobium roseum]TNC58933.1 hypothetical protein FHG71_23255 [Rubellimicrobium roseum]
MRRVRSPEHQRDNLAFPLRIKIRTPPRSNPRGLNVILDWLEHEIGQGQFALHMAQTTDDLAVAFYFRRVEDMLALLAEFPELVLAEGRK